METEREARNLDIQRQSSLPHEHVDTSQVELRSSPQIAKGPAHSMSAVLDGRSEPENSTANTIADRSPSSSSVIPATDADDGDSEFETFVVTADNYRLALDLLPEDSDQRPDVLGYIATTLYEKFVQTGEVNVINEAIYLNREELSLRLVGHSDRPISLNNLANMIQARYGSFGDVGDLNEAVTLHREALSLFPIGHKNRSTSLTNLSGAINIRYERFSDVNDINEAVTLSREAIDLLPAGHKERSRSLNNLAAVILARYERFGDVDDINEAISLNREALSLRPVGHTNRSNSLSNLANAIKTRCERFGDVNDINEAINLHREALSLRPVGHTDRSSSLNSLSVAIQIKYERFSDVNDINEAVNLSREAIDLLPAGHNERSRSLNNLAAVILARYERFGDVDDINEAISLNRESLSLRPAGHNDRSQSLSNLAAVILTRYERFGDVDDINEAIFLNRESCSLRPDSHNSRSDSLINLANAIWTRYERFGDVDDINEAIAFHREALSLRPTGHNDRSDSLNNLATAIRTRYERFGDVDDIIEIVALNREAIDLLPASHNDRSNSFNTLAGAIETRYERFGDVDDINEAIAFHREALSLCPVGHKNRSCSLSHLANAIKTRYERFDDGDDINEAIYLHREALSLRPVGHNDRSNSLNNLANAIKIRYQRLVDANDINEAITFHREALSLFPVGHKSRSLSLRNLAGSIQARYERLGDVNDINAAIVLNREALELEPPGHYLRYWMLISLSYSLIVGVVQGGLDRDSSLHAMEEARPLVIEAVTVPSAPLASQLDNAFYHGGITAYPTDFGIFLQLQCIKLLQSLVVVNHSVSSLQIYLHGYEDVASTLTARALTSGSPETSAILFDGGRSLLLGTFQRYRSPIEELRHVSQELAERLQSVGSELERLALLGEATVSTPEFTTSLDFMLAVQRNLREQWDCLLEQIHALPGFEHFLITSSFSELRAAASDGPVILLNAHESRCDAIIIFSSGSPDLVPIQDPASLDSLHELQQELSTSWHENLSKEREVLIKTFRFLWEHVVSKVVACLMSRGVKRGGRVWWCPASIFSLLPIHAAGMYDGEPDRNLSDIYISSYTPTISELIRARRPGSASLEPLEQPHRLLFIGNSGKSADPLKELKEVETELAAILTTVPGITSITSTDANRDIVLDKIQQQPWAHFSCHGEVDTEDPTKSHFVLEHESRLHVKDILSVNLPNAGLAFLSACHSAAPGEALPDEAIHLSSAMMFAGFRSVVGTMWEMYDAEGPIVSGLFYKNLMKLGGRHTDAAKALHRTIRARCKSDQKEGIFRPERWAMLIHLGA